MQTFLKFLVQLTGFIIAISAGANDADSILAGIMAGMKKDSYYAELTMTTIRPHFTREITAKTWNINGEFSIITVETPFRDKGMTFMMTGSEIWNYVPGKSQMTKLEPSMMTQSWMGSDFLNYELIENIAVIRENYNSVITGSGQIEGKDCHIVKLTPAHDSLNNQGIIMIWVTKDKYQHLKTENYDQEGMLTRVISLGEMKTINGREIPTRVEIKPAKPGYTTIIEFTDISFDMDVINRIDSDQSIVTIIDLLPDDFFSRYNTTQITDK
jgi:outer membrane lipoprotein-sorting protein